MQPAFQEEDDEPLPSGERGRNSESYFEVKSFFFFLTLVVSLGLKLKTVERIQSQTDIPGDYEGKKIWPKGAPWADEL